MDFFKICTKVTKDSLEIYPDFVCNNPKDLMIRGKSFYAVWDEEKKLWSTNEYDLQQMVDKKLYEFANEKYSEVKSSIKTFTSFNTNVLKLYRQYLACMPDNWKPLNDKIIFANSVIKQEDYASKVLPYNLEKGQYSAYNEIMNTLYDKDEKQKLEWAIGSIISGDSKKLQKFIVLYGAPGSGKSTFLHILQQLFEGYYSMFDAKSIVGNTNLFATEIFKNNPLIAIQHDGDLSKIEDNSKLNSIVSHEAMVINEKYKASYTATLKCLLFLGTNTPVKITDSKSGLMRRLLDVTPTGKTIPEERYLELMAQIPFELGAIAHHCYNVYKRLGFNYYSSYKPHNMMQKTNLFFNFIDENFEVFEQEDKTTLSQAYLLYKKYCQDVGKQFFLGKPEVRDELKTYFRDYERFYHIDGKTIRDFYQGFLKEKIIGESFKPKENYISSVQLNETKSIFDQECAECLAQYASDEGIPLLRWKDVTTKLKDLDTSKLHYVKLPENHIVIDFDIQNEEGQKDDILNCREAKKFPPTYAEFSKSGKGVHLHYIWDGDASKLAHNISDDVEIKVFLGGSSLRRKYSKSNDIGFTTISSGLPLKENKKMTNISQIQSEHGLRKLIERNLNKEIHSATKPSIDFIFKILEDAYNSDITYNLNDIRNKVLQFAASSSNNSDYCVNLVNQMKFASKQESQSNDISNGEIVFYDVEVFPNLFIVCYKMAGEDKQVIKMINPTALDIEQLFKFKLIGFNCRRYDNHILYARYLGYSNEQLYQLSQKIINEHGGLFGEAYNLSYTDIYDFSNKKQSLKKWEIELGSHHMELSYKWDQPVSEDKWQEVADYCINDVLETEKLFNHLKGDWIARQILATLANGSVNDTTNQLATKFIFGNKKHPQLVYTDLSTIFPGYELRNEVGKDGKNHLTNMYRNTDVGFGGYVHAKYGVYYNVALLDVASMHPTSLILLNYFGEYTSKFADILNARLAIKHGDYINARSLMGGILAPFLEDESQTEALAYALKIVINSQYGLTSSRFDLPQVDKRNVNNIVALRGALFMRTLQDEVTNRGYEVIHIKTDSIKIAEATPEIIDFCKEFAKSYGYTFEHEATFEKMCLITDADYIGKYSWAEKAKNIGQWTATGAQFAHPFVFKTLFSREPILFDDLCETKAVKTAIYLDMNEQLEVDSHNHIFVGKVGQFCPIQEGKGGGILVAERNDKFNAVTGTKGYRWLEANTVRQANKQNDIDLNYFFKMSDEMFARISEYTDAEIFCSNTYLKGGERQITDDGPLLMDCGNMSCEGCSQLREDAYHSGCAIGINILEK